MDVFVNMPLNLAHSYERKAERLKKEAKWEEAKEMYLKAAEKMNETISKSNTKNQVRDMLVFQRDHFMRQRNEIEDLSKASEKEKLRKEQQPQEQSIVPTPTSGVTGDKPTTTIEDDIVDYSSVPDSMLAPTTENKPAPGKRKKYPKADTDVIEELQVHNHELRHLVENLLSKIDVLVREKELLLEGNRTLREENERLLNYTDMQRRLLITGGGESPLLQFDNHNDAGDDDNDSLLPLVEMGGDCFNFTSVVNELSNAIADDDSY